MVDRTASVTGLWSAAATWGGSDAPADGQTWAINAGVVVTFDVDQSAFANGIGAGSISGTLKHLTDGTRTYLKAAGSITINAGGAYFCGNSLLDPIPFSSDATPSVATIAFNGNVRFAGTVPPVFYGATRLLSDQLYQGQAAADTTIILTTGLSLRSGDVIYIENSGSAGANATAHTVNSYVSATKTVTLSAAIDRIVSAADRVAIQSCPILCFNIAKTAGSFMSGTNGTIAVGARFYNFALSPFANASYGHSMSYCVSHGNNAGGLSNAVWNSTFSDCISFNNLYGGLAGVSSSDCLFIRCVAFNNTFGGLCGSSGARIGCSNCIFHECISFNNTLGGLSNHSSSNKFFNCESKSSNTGGDLYDSNSSVLYNTKMCNAVEFYGYNGAFISPNSYSPSYDHDQSLGSFKAWMRGGIVASVASPEVGDTTIWMLLTPESLTYPVFREYYETLEVGQKMKIRCKIQKDSAMTYLPRIQMIDPTNDPLVDSTKSPLVESIMTDSINTTEVLNISYKNVKTSRMPVIIRVIGKSASGVIYSRAWKVLSKGGSVILL